MFNNHTVAATAIMIGILGGRPDSPRRQREVGVCAGGGAAFGVGICNELPSAALVGLVFLLLWSQVPRAMWSLLFVGALIPLGMFFWTNYQATGGLRPFYSFYGTEKYAFIHEGVPSYWMSPRGIDSNRGQLLGLSAALHRGASRLVLADSGLPAVAGGLGRPEGSGRGG